MTKPDPAAAMAPSAGSTDRIGLMQTFVRIVESGSLSAAAAQLGATQPTVSRRLQVLERALGLRLLQRSTHAMRLTLDGERCYEQAKQLLASWEAFQSQVRGASEEPEGILRVVVPHAFGQELLVRLLAKFLQRHPRVTVEWLLHDDIKDFIAAGIDCAIQVGEVRDPALVAIRVAEVPRFVVAAPALLAADPAPTRPAELGRLPWLALRPYYRQEVLLRHGGTGETCRLAIQPKMSTDSLYALRCAAVLGLGACVGSAWLLAEDLEAGRLVRLAADWQADPLPMQVVYPYARHYPARLRRFVAAMRAEIPAAVGGARP